MQNDKQKQWLAEQFEGNRGHLRAVAYRMLGSASEADDAVQEAWLRLSRSDASAIDNLAGWLTTVVSRVCLDMLRSRMAQREEALDTNATKPIATGQKQTDPEQETLLADSVGFALLIVLDRLDPAERLAFVLHDMFAPSMRLPRFLAGRPRRRDNSPAVHAGEFRGRPRFRRPASPNNGTSPTPFLPPYVPETSKGSSRCLILMSSCESTKRPPVQVRPARFVARGTGRREQSHSRSSLPETFGRCWSMERWALSGHPRDTCSGCFASRLRMGRLPQST